MMQPTDLDAPPTTPGQLLRRPDELARADLSTMHGFGGLHGGLLLGVLTTQLSATAGGRTLRYTTAQFHRPATGTVEMESGPADVGRSLTRVRGRATDSITNRELMTAIAVFDDADASESTRPITAPAMPDVRPPEANDTFAIPHEFVPFTQHVEIRPTDTNRPFAGGPEPTLTAWIRLVDDDMAPDAYRLITLLDALAPSYAAVLSQPVAIPTIELSVRVSPALRRASSPWILLQASTVTSNHGWVDERIEAWAPDGNHLGTATQVRLVRP